jgi:hypothetical protein
MAENKPNPDWRQANKGKAAAPPAGAGGGKRGWQKQAAEPAGPKKPWSRGSKLAFGVFLASLLMGLVGVVILWPRAVSPACLVLLGASYDDNLAVPHNAFGWKNLDDLDKLKDQADLFTGSGKPRLRHRSLELKGPESWKKEWAKFSRSIEEKAVILYLALHGAADAKEPYFFLSDDQGYVRLPFVEVLATLDKELSDKHVVLLLEPALARANWSAGVLENNFVAKLKDLNPTLKKNRLFILCASAPHQISWPSEEWQQTLFGHFVVEGLRGAALRSGDRLTIDDLFKYVHERVVARSQVEHGVEQTPIFIGDEGLAAEIEIAQFAKTFEEEPLNKSPGLNFTVPTELTEHWKGWQELGKSTPHPTVYSPALWRRYQDLLIRYEQLLRAGDPTRKAREVIAGRLDAMRKQLQAEARLDVAETTLSLSLPMAQTLGVALPIPEEELKNGVEKIWGAAKSELRREYLKDFMDVAKKKHAGMSAAQLRAQVYQTFLRFLEGSPIVREAELVGKQNEKEDSRSKTDALLDLFDEQLATPRSAEVHFVTMLLKDVRRDPAPDLKLLKQSLRVRQLAERAALSTPDAANAHSYSEILMPWIQGGLANADAFRRPGEDYLFGSVKDDWDKAEGWLNDAEAAYRETLKEAQWYRFALATHDSALADLPYYAQWVASQRVSADNLQLERVEACRQQVELLEQRLEKLHAELFKDKGAIPSATLANVAAKDVADSVAILQKQIESDMNEANIDRHTHILWLDREAFLAVPPLVPDSAGVSAVETRMTMLGYNRGTSEKFFLSKDVPKAFGGNAKDDAAAASKRNLQMATVAFRPFWREEMARVENGNALAVAEVIAELAKQWPKTINEALDQSFREGVLAEASQALRKADYLARGLPGGFADKVDPMSVSQALRWLRMHDLMIAQARRAVLDHWYSERDGQPYYKTAADMYLNVAKQLVEIKGETMDINKLRLMDVRRAQETVKVTGLAIDGVKEAYWTSEKEFPVRWTIKTPDDPYLIDIKGADQTKAPPPAVAIVKRDLEGGKWKNAADASQRKSIELRTQLARDFPDDYFLETKDDIALKATYTVLLRGKHEIAKLDISQKEPDVIVHSFPEPPQSFVKVRMHKDFTYGAISIAFDISGSMIWKSYGIVGPDGVKRPRFDYAIEALEKTLKIIPDGTYVSVFAFATKDTKENQAAGFNALPAVVEIQPATQWSQDKVGRAIDEINILAKQAWQEQGPGTPQGSTPLAYAIGEYCLQKGFPPNFRGAKVILALSDGDDTSSDRLLVRDRVYPATDWRRSNGDLASDYNQKVEAYLRSRLGTKDVEVRVVCFLNDKDKASAAEAGRAKKQFEVVETFLRKGSFEFAPDPLELAKRLDLAIRPRLVITDTPPGFEPEGVVASLSKEEQIWKPIPANQYRIRVRDSEERELIVRPGEMIGITLKRDPVDLRKVIYEREMYADFIAPLVPPLAEDTQGRYRVSLLQNETEPKSNLLTQFIAVEALSKDSAVVQQAAPFFVWIESKPKSPRPLLLSRWYREYGYPALGYRVLGSNWPTMPPNNAVATPEIKAWLADNPASPVFAMPLDATLKKNKAKIPLGNQFAEIEIAGETMDVVTNSRGHVGRNTLPRQALVVRVQHAKGFPVFVQLTGGKHKGEEHRFYSDANKYTAIFWDLANPNQEEFSFNIIFLEALKREVTPASLPASGRINSNFPTSFPRMGN